MVVDNQIYENADVTSPIQSEAIQIKAILSTSMLPALPQTAARVLSVSRNLDCGPIDLAEPIEADSSLVAQVLQFVNSSYFGFRQKISSVRQAVSLVGNRAIKNFVLWTAVYSVIPDPKCAQFSLRDLRTDALRRGVFAKSLAKLLGAADVEEAFTAGLLQDIAVPLLARDLGEIYTALLFRRDDGRVRLSQLEREVFGWTHAEVAASLLEEWHLPRELAILVRSHTDAEQLLAQTSPPAAAVAVAMSSLLPAATDRAWPERQSLEFCWDQLPLRHQSALPDFLKMIDEAYNELANSLGVVGGADSIAARFAGSPCAASMCASNNS